MPSGGPREQGGALVAPQLPGPHRPLHAQWAAHQLSHHVAGAPGPLPQDVQSMTRPLTGFRPKLWALRVCAPLAVGFGRALPLPAPRRLLCPRGGDQVWVMAVPVASALGVVSSGTSMQTPWPRVRAYRGLGSPGSARQLSPRPQRAVATPQAAPNGRAHVGQQPQPAGRAGSGHEAGTGGQSASLSAEQGAQRHGWGVPTTAPSWAASRRKSGQAQAAGTADIAGRVADIAGLVADRSCSLLAARWCRWVLAGRRMLAGRSARLLKGLGAGSPEPLG